MPESVSTGRTAGLADAWIAGEAEGESELWSVVEATALIVVSPVRPLIRLPAPSPLQRGTNAAICRFSFRLPLTVARCTAARTGLPPSGIG